MIGRSTSSKPASSSSETKRDSARRRRAVSSTSSGLTPVGYLNFVAIKIKNPLRRAAKGVDQIVRLVRSNERPFVAGRISQSTPTSRGDGGGAARKTVERSSRFSVCERGQAGQALRIMRHEA